MSGSGIDDRECGCAKQNPCQSLAWLLERTQNQSFLDRMYNGSEFQTLNIHIFTAKLIRIDNDIVVSYDKLRPYEIEVDIFLA